MRKLLVASQKSGIGKTTTAINVAAAAAQAGARVLLVEADPMSNISMALNLSQHANQCLLKANDIDLPGVVFCEVTPRLDVFSPYEQGGCSDEDFDRILQMLALDAFQEGYDCLIVNAPPFLGGRPGELLASCDEYIIVMQAEPLAYRTMPAFLELVQRSTQAQGGKAANLRGIVLTLPESETPGGRWERELRGRFGKMVLPHVIPYDEEVGKAALFGSVVVRHAPETPAALIYQDLAQELSLAKEASRKARPASDTLVLAAHALKTQPLRSRVQPQTITGASKKSSARIPRFRPPEVPMVRHEAAESSKTAAPAVKTPPLPVDRPRPEKPAARVPEAKPVMRPPEVQPVAPSSRIRKPQPTAAPAPVPVAAPVAPPAPEPKPEPPAAKGMSGLWVMLAVLGGVALRFVQLPDFAVPIVVGVAVSAGITLILLLQNNQSTAESPQLATSQVGAQLSGVHKKVPNPAPRRK